MLEITPLELTVNWGNTQFVYNGHSQSPTANVNNPVLSETVNIEITGAETDAGEYVAVCAIIAENNNETNYILLNAQIGYEISAKDLSVSFEGNIYKVYDGTTNLSVASVINGEFIFNGVIGNDDLGFAYKNAQFISKNVNYVNNKVIVSNLLITNNNYNLSTNDLEIDAFITAKPITVTVGENIIKKYGENDLEIVYEVEGIIEGDALSGVLAREQGENVGTYAILVGTLTELNNPNYSITYDLADFIIVANQLTINVLVASLTKVYDGTINVQLDFAWYELIGLVNEDIVELTYDAFYNSKNVNQANKVEIDNIRISNANYSLLISNMQIDAEITPVELEVNWGNTMFIYNGLIQNPSASVNSPVQNETVNIQISNGKVNAGEYWQLQALWLKIITKQTIYY